MFNGIGKTLIYVGILLIIIGAFLMVCGKLGLGRLPGDIVYKKGNFTFYFPLMTSILISLILTIIFWLLKK
ncbi:DUF2905 domain-containing protein [Aceticella autotrophica]|uniref:DUF2905 domain-containing protein n=1 Tax=Aceticella autotrophica TaxID=2755338 RepID=A0A975AUL3_9THEO|nr:DUF2905 domain-containing protein [Aceticella autotrophica]MDI6603558.1 DUF2905 domain-containing protein [Thermoanaerobacteraceae bacterium]QSZ26733.1 DUF2905 domain-containing protein [Aceticella autotrophica]